MNAVIWKISQLILGNERQLTHHTEDTASFGSAGTGAEESSCETPKGDVQEEEERHKSDGRLERGDEEDERDDAPRDEVNAESIFKLGGGRIRRTNVEEGDVEGYEF